MNVIPRKLEGRVARFANRALSNPAVTILLVLGLAGLRWITTVTWQVLADRLPIVDKKEIRAVRWRIEVIESMIAELEKSILKRPQTVRNSLKKKR